MPKSAKMGVSVFCMYRVYYSSDFEFDEVIFFNCAIVYLNTIYIFVVVCLNFWSDSWRILVQLFSLDTNCRCQKYILQVNNSWLQEVWYTNVIVRFSRQESHTKLTESSSLNWVLYTSHPSQSSVNILSLL